MRFLIVTTYHHGIKLPPSKRAFTMYQFVLIKIYINIYIRLIRDDVFPILVVHFWTLLRGTAQCLYNCAQNSHLRLYFMCCINVLVYACCINMLYACCILCLVWNFLNPPPRFKKMKPNGYILMWESSWHFHAVSACCIKMLYELHVCLSVVCVLYQHVV